MIRITHDSRYAGTYLDNEDWIKENTYRFVPTVLVRTWFLYVPWIELPRP